MSNRQKIDSTPSRSGIGTLKEKSFHADLIKWVAEPGDEFEANIDGFVVDIVRKEQLIEIQTRNFASIKKKVHNLGQNHQLNIVYPIAQNKWIVREEENGERIGRRKSPKHGKMVEVFNELIRIPKILLLPKISICVVLVEVEEIWKNDGKGSWRRGKWSISGRHLINVIDHQDFHGPEDLLALLPKSLPGKFTNNEIAENIGVSKSLARKMTYCLRKMETLEIVGKHGREYLYSIIK